VATVVEFDETIWAFLGGRVEEGGWFSFHIVTAQRNEIGELLVDMIMLNAATVGALGLTVDSMERVVQQIGIAVSTQQTLSPCRKQIDRRRIQTQTDSRSVHMVVDAQVRARRQTGQPAAGPLLATGINGGRQVLVKDVLRPTRRNMMKLPHMGEEQLKLVKRGRFDRGSIQLNEMLQ
jgi:hypothetical protein